MSTAVRPPDALAHTADRVHRAVSRTAPRTRAARWALVAAAVLVQLALAVVLFTLA